MPAEGMSPAREVGSFLKIPSLVLRRISFWGDRDEHCYWRLSCLWFFALSKLLGLSWLSPLTPPGQRQLGLQKTLAGSGLSLRLGKTYLMHPVESSFPGL